MNVSSSVAEAPGAIDELDGFVPLAIVVTGVAVGVNGDPVGTTPVAE